jgi:hypothetical protein
VGTRVAVTDKRRMPGADHRLIEPAELDVTERRQDVPVELPAIQGSGARGERSAGDTSCGQPVVGVIGELDPPGIRVEPLATVEVGVSTSLMS